MVFTILIYHYWCPVMLGGIRTLGILWHQKKKWIESTFKTLQFQCLVPTQRSKHWSSKLALMW